MHVEIDIYATGSETVRVDVLIFPIWGGVGWDVNVHVKLHTYVMLRQGWGGVGC